MVMIDRIRDYNHACFFFLVYLSIPNSHATFFFTRSCLDVYCG